MYPCTALRVHQILAPWWYNPSLSLPNLNLHVLYAPHLISLCSSMNLGPQHLGGMSSRVPHPHPMRKLLPIVMNLMTRSVLKICNTTLPCRNPIWKSKLKFQFKYKLQLLMYICVYFCITFWKLQLKMYYIYIHHVEQWDLAAIGCCYSHACTGCLTEEYMYQLSIDCCPAFHFIPVLCLYRYLSSELHDAFRSLVISPTSSIIFIVGTLIFSTIHTTSRWQIIIILG